MEKYSQYRDKGSGIAPFFPVPIQPAGIYLPFYAFLFVLRIPVLLFVSLSYFLLFSWLPIGSLGKKAALWLIMAVPGLWWVDIQIDGVKRGSLARQKPTQTPIPGPGSIIAASSTSPIDALYLAAIFDPVFTISYPTTRLVQPTTLLSAILRALAPPSPHPPTTPPPTLVSLTALRRQHPDRPIVVFPECSTTNGRAILPLSPSLLSAPPDAKIFPTSLRYTPADITTPVPGAAAALTFLWNLCSRPTHTIRVRIAEPVQNAAAAGKGAAVPNTYATNFLDSLDRPAARGAGRDEDADGDVGAEEQKVLDHIAEALARLGRVKRVGLGVKEKGEFVASWLRRRR